MTDKFSSVAVQYIKHSTARAHVRPYQNSLALRNDIGVWLDTEPLPEPGHWRVELEVQVLARNTDDVLCFEASTSLEAIVVTQGLTDEEAVDNLRYSVAPALFGNARSVLSSSTAGTGYGPFVLPPIEAARIAQLPSRKGAATETEME